MEKDLSKYERFIFDLDRTLLFGNFCLLEEDYFKDALSLDEIQGKKFVSDLRPYLAEYEETFPRYKIKTLSAFLSIKYDMYISPEVIEGWIDLSCDTKDIVESSAIELFEDLKSKGKDIAVLTNFFEKTQVARLKNSGLLPYITQVYSGEDYVKPTKEAYLCSTGNFDIDKCIMIGDNYEKDYLAPRESGMYSILYDSEGIMPKKDDIIKSLIKLKGRY